MIESTSDSKYKLTLGYSGLFLLLVRTICAWIGRWWWEVDIISEQLVRHENGIRGGLEQNLLLLLLLLEKMLFLSLGQLSYKSAVCCN